MCQTMQNVYRSTRKIKIRWLSQDKSGDPAGEIYKPDFYDITGNCFHLSGVVIFTEVVFYVKYDFHRY